MASSARTRMERRFLLFIRRYLGHPSVHQSRTATVYNASSAAARVSSTEPGLDYVPGIPRETRMPCTGCWMSVLNPPFLRRCRSRAVPASHARPWPRCDLRSRLRGFTAGFRRGMEAKPARNEKRTAGDRTGATAEILSASGQGRADGRPLSIRCPSPSVIFAVLAAMIFDELVDLHELGRILSGVAGIAILAPPRVCHRSLQSLQ